MGVFNLFFGTAFSIPASTIFNNPSDGFAMGTFLNALLELITYARIIVFWPFIILLTLYILSNRKAFSEISFKFNLKKYMSSEIAKSLQFICDEKGLEYNVVLDALQAALGAAYRKDFGNKQQNIQVVFDPETGDMKVWDEKEVVEDIDEETLLHDQEELAKRREEAHKAERDLSEEEMEGLMRFNPKTQMMLTEAKTHNKKIKIGDTVKIMETRPLSKQKCWRVVEILEEAK